MRIITVGSGSKGNCYAIESDGHFLVLDAGCRWKDVVVGCGFSTYAIDACLVTHRHLDHSGYIKDFSQNGIPVISNNWTADELRDITGESVKCVPLKKWCILGERYTILLFDVTHENVANCGFIIEFANKERLLYVTDFEYIKYVLRNYKINHYLIAVNHTENIPDDADARMHRIMGHSSLDTVKAFLRANMTEACKSVTACHLSALYADAERVERELKELCGDKVQVNIARKGEVINLPKGSD